MLGRNGWNESQAPAPMRRSRTRSLVVFTVLLIASSAVPVLAAEPSPSAPAEEPAAAPSGIELPDAEDVQAGLEEAERAEAERERWLQSPEAVLQRERSRYAFADLGPAEARQLLLERFSEQLERLDKDPARFLSDANLLRPMGGAETVATVSSQGDGTLLDAGIPVRAEDEGGDLAKVDLSLEATSEGFEPVNPLTDLSIPEEAAEPIEIGDGGLAVSSAAASPESEAQLLGGEDVFYPDAHGAGADADRLVAPIAGGVEIFDLLRSADSPETFRYALELPAGAELRPDGSGGAIAVGEAEVLASIPFPYAIDAQGTYVPVELEIEGSELVLDVAHREADVAYPILLDPAIFEDWYNANWFNGHRVDGLTAGAWSYHENWGWIQSATSCIYTCWGVHPYRGLYISMPGGGHGAQEWGQWIYSAPNSNSFLAGAWLNPFVRNDHSCNRSQYPEPHDYLGMWHNGSWNTTVLGNQAIAQGRGDPNGWGSLLVFGLSTGSGSITPCWRDLALGGAAIWLDDWQRPTVDSVTGAPGGWIGRTDSFTLTANVHDEGLGIYRVVLARAGGGQPIVHDLGCNGLSTNRCPTTRSEPFAHTGAAFDEGIQPIAVTATDPTAKTSDSWQGTTRVDGTRPAVTLSGQLATATDEAGNEEQAPGTGDELSLPVYDLTIAATDIGPESDANAKKRSGVEDIEIWLDGNELAVPWGPQPCPGPDYSCPMTKTYSLNLTGLTTAGEHDLEVKVKDQVGNVRERTIEFEYYPATGIEDSYVMHYFPLPDGQGNEAEEERPDRPELAVNVMNGNLVYREEDIEVDGPGVDLEVERYYNSQLPAAENGEWGDGWTLAQTPDLELVAPDADPGLEEARLLEESGSIEDDVDLPEQTGEVKFDPSLQATLAKTASGYELSDETGESATSTYFGETGRTEALLTDGYAKVDYLYEAGKLAEIAVEDPGSAGNPTEAPQEESAPPSTGPYTGVLYADAFGTEGSGPGQLKHPAGVAIDPAGDLWVVDRGNDRVQKFSSEGELLDQFGSSGTGDGQFASPADVAIDLEGNLWVTDSGNHRVQKFDSKGEFLLKFGSLGTGNRQFNGPSGIVAAPMGGWIYVVDRGNHRIQLFAKEGAFLGANGSYGWEDPQYDEPTAVAVGPPLGGWAYTLYIVDSGNDRIKRHLPNGAFVAKFGTYGAGDGQLDSPATVDVDAKGNVWVADRLNARVQLFDRDGNYVDRFGAKGAEEGQFDLAYPMGIATDDAGGIWVTDGNHNRLQKWVAGSYEPDPGEELPDDDPSVDATTANGLVTAIGGEEAGTHSYVYSGDDLVSHSGPQGKSSYVYDSQGRMTKVTLPNGTWGQVAYRADGRVLSVTVDPAGTEAAKTTEFQYSDEPRRTTVTPPDKAQIVYDIAADGSVLKWRYAETPPDLEPLGGSLYDEREKWVATGAQNLIAQAKSPHGIASIEVIANGSQLVDEATCEQDPAKEGLECLGLLIDEWVVETGSLTPGVMQLEVVATDRLGRSESERFWVDVPYTPPEAPGALTPPKFMEILRFREDYGLEVVFPVANELELNDRIFELMNAWHNPHTPAGEVARASWARWGVPLRHEDVAELEYRDSYIGKNIGLIENWALTNHSATYAGYYVDHRAGGILHVGFTHDQGNRIADLKVQLPLAAEDRLAVYPMSPQSPRTSLTSAYETLDNAMDTNVTLQNLVTDLSVDESGNEISIGATNVSQALQAVGELIGQQIPVDVHPGAVRVPVSGRHRTSGRMRAGDRILNQRKSCTAGFGAFEERPQKSNGKMVTARFLLTAGHCYALDDDVHRSDRADHEDPAGWAPVGQVTRRAFHGTQPADGLAIRTKIPNLVPHGIFGSDGGLIPTRSPSKARVGNTLCYSGATRDGVSCGEVTRVTMVWAGPLWLGEYNVKFNKRVHEGDSGAPVWNPRTGAAVGLVGAHYGGTQISTVAPLLHPKGLSLSRVPGILHHPSMLDMHLITGG